MIFFLSRKSTMIKWSKLKSPMQQSMTLKYLVLFVGMCSVLEEKEESKNIYFIIIIQGKYRRVQPV